MRGIRKCILSLLGSSILVLFKRWVSVRGRLNPVGCRLLIQPYFRAQIGRFVNFRFFYFFRLLIIIRILMSMISKLFCEHWNGGTKPLLLFNYRIFGILLTCGGWIISWWCRGQACPIIPTVLTVDIPGKKFWKPYVCRISSVLTGHLS